MRSNSEIYKWAEDLENYIQEKYDEAGLERDVYTMVDDEAVYFYYIRRGRENNEDSRVYITFIAYIHDHQFITRDIIDFFMKMRISSKALALAGDSKYNDVIFYLPPSIEYFFGNKISDFLFVNLLQIPEYLPAKERFIPDKYENDYNEAEPWG
jgi:hypothetical protein